MEKECQILGIDISKDTFDVSYADGSSYYHQQYANTPSGHDAFGATLGASSHCVMEATGGYHLRLAVYLHERGITVSVVNPLVIRRFIQMRLRRAKTDKADAEQIARYGQSERPSPWQPDPAAVTHMSQLSSMLEQVTTQETAYRHQRHAFDLQPDTDPSMRTLLDTEIDHQQALKRQLLRALVELARTTYGDAFSALVSIPGIGEQTASLLVMVTNGFTAFETPKQLVAYLGLSPRQYQSGSSIRGRGHICKMGMGHIRAALYVCSWSAVRYNGPCKDFYARLRANGKPANVALIAVVNKLLRQAFAIATARSRFETAYQGRTRQRTNGN